MDATVPAMTAVDHNIIAVLDDTVDLDALHEMVERPEVMGLMLKTGAAYAGQQGAIFWHQGKPIVSVKKTLWDGFDSPNEIVNFLNSAPTDSLNNQGAYTIVNVHPWSTSTADGGQGNPMSNVDYIVDRLNPAVRVVTLEELMIHLRNNFGNQVDPGFGQNLLRNPDFEVLAASPPNRPTDWFYAAAPGATQLVNVDSDGQGQRAAAINQASADWRSRDMDVTPMEQLEFSFEFMLTGVPSGSGFRADARFFSSSGGAFVGETAKFFNAANYAPGVWHTFTTIAVVPAGGEVGDVRFSTFFGPFAGGQVLIDNVSLLRRDIIGDFNGDGNVNGDDLLAWKASFGQSSAADADGDGDSDGVDFLAWQRHFGETHANAVAAATGVPEPASSALILAWLAVSACLPHATK
jgi:hypothetical protein